ncbi:hypothetical protein AGMMS49942_29390 [Spirochaetia bacterium]|nr:hypothetical protein AGMMS49942_29390 [Spirochaetia bacterium]
MQKTGIRALFFAACVLVFLSGCASTPPANREQDAVNAANAALGAMK